MNPAHKSRWAFEAVAPELSVVELMSMRLMEGVRGKQTVQNDPESLFASGQKCYQRPPTKGDSLTLPRFRCRRFLKSANPYANEKFACHGRSSVTWSVVGKGYNGPTMRVPEYRGTSRVAINLTPMIDVTFLLIIFFLVSSHLAKQENFLPLDLPSATSGIGDFSTRSTLTIQVPRDGGYQIAGGAVDLAQVRSFILARAEAEGDQPIRIRIRTDQGVPYAAIAKLLKTIALTGQSDVVFSVYEGEK
jgi:biopolymer transport protein ExbD